MTYQTSGIKFYYIPRYFQAEWVHTRTLCKEYGLEAVSFDSLEEAENFLQLCKQKTHLLNAQTHVGGMSLEAKSLEKWYWVNSGNRVNYTLPFGPNEPNCDGGKEFCLSVSRNSNNDFAFNDIKCSGSDKTKFICQQARILFLIPVWRKLMKLIKLWIDFVKLLSKFMNKISEVWLLLHNICETVLKTKRGFFWNCIKSLLIYAIN